MFRLLNFVVFLREIERLASGNRFVHAEYGHFALKGVLSI